MNSDEYIVSVNNRTNFYNMSPTCYIILELEHLRLPCISFWLLSFHLYFYYLKLYNRILMKRYVNLI